MDTVHGGEGQGSLLWLQEHGTAESHLSRSRCRVLDLRTMKACLCGSRSPAGPRSNLPSGTTYWGPGDNKHVSLWRVGMAHSFSTSPSGPCLSVPFRVI